MNCKCTHHIHTCTQCSYVHVHLRVGVNVLVLSAIHYLVPLLNYKHAMLRTSNLTTKNDYVQIAIIIRTHEIIGAQNI